jgi:transcriptional regulator with XRE-family HTH domain
MEIETTKLVKTLMSLRGVSQADLAKKTKVSKASLSKFLNQTSDLRGEALLKVLKSLGINITTIMTAQISNELGHGSETTVAEDLKFLVEKAEPIARKTMVDTMIASHRNDKSPEIRTRLQRLKKYRDSIKTVRRQSC